MLFRYPGGKGKQATRIFEHILFSVNGHLPEVFCEPFVGGGSVVLALIQNDHNYKVKRIFLNDSDRWVSTFWHIVSGENPVQFAALREKVLEPVTIEVFRERRARYKPESFKDRYDLCLDPIEAAYNALFFNRTTFSGILSSGAIGGDKQTGKSTVYCRWNGKRLQKDLDSARELLQGRTKVSCHDWKDLKVPPEAFLYVDPPYFKKGNALYPQTWTPEDHAALRDWLSLRESPWLLSYDNRPQVKELYKDFEVQAFNHFRSMGNAKVARPKDDSELLIWRPMVQSLL